MIIRMKKSCYGIFVLLLVTLFGMTVRAEGEDTVKTGIYAGEIDLSGKTKEAAEAAVSAYVEELKSVEIKLLGAQDEEIVTTAGELGISWANTDFVQEALEIGKHGNVIERYKALKNLQYENKVYDIELDFDLQAISNLLAEKGEKFNRPAVNASLKRTDGKFEVEEGEEGYKLDVEASIDLIYEYLNQEWNREPCGIKLDIVVEEPKGSAEDLAQVQDILGSFTTSYSTSGSSRSANVANGSALINGTTLYPGEEFSTQETVAPFTAENGYYMAGSYLNGKVVDSLGGGICQVSTTLYNAVLNAELEVTERHNHSMIVSYVDPSADAAIAESAGKDFRFVNNTDYPIYIESFTENKKITFHIYGKETRSANRQVRYESEVLEVIRPPADQIYADASHPIGYIVKESAHIGYKARLWKVVTENGKEISRDQVNSSSYKMVPRSATVGTGTGDPAAYEEIMAAIGTANIDHVQNVIALLTAQPADANSVEVGEQ